MDKALDKRDSTISSMFNGIATKYDLLNHILSLNIDKLWRKELVNFLTQYSLNTDKTYYVADIACGTGDLSIALFKKGIKVCGIDISSQMLEVAKIKTKKLLNKRGKLNSNVASIAPEYIIGNAECLNFKDREFDAITIAFGIRNFNKRDICLKEIYRVIKPGGHLAILEFAAPKNKLIKYFYNLYFKNILPFIGRLISKDKSAYKYLVESVENFPKYEDFCKEIKAANFKDIKYKKLSFGIATLYTASV